MKKLTNFQIATLVHISSGDSSKLLEQLSTPVSELPEELKAQIQELVDAGLLQRPESSSEPEATVIGDLHCSMFQSLPLPDPIRAASVNDVLGGVRGIMNFDEIAPIVIQMMVNKVRGTSFSEASEMCDIEFADKLINEWLAKTPVGFRLFSGIDEHGKTHTFTTDQIVEHIKKTREVERRYIAMCVSKIIEMSNDFHDLSENSSDLFSKIVGSMIDPENPASVEITHDHAVPEGFGVEQASV